MRQSFTPPLHAPRLGLLAALPLLSIGCAIATTESAEARQVVLNRVIVRDTPKVIIINGNGQGTVNPNPIVVNPSVYPVPYPGGNIYHSCQYTCYPGNVPTGYGYPVYGVPGVVHTPVYPPSYPVYPQQRGVRGSFTITF